MNNDEVASPVSGNQIVVMDRGWVYVGRVSIDREQQLVTIQNARNIRRWGTNAGLGELAERGPQPATKLDPYGTVVAPIRAVIHFIACKTEW
jgi:hypothetical protein